jgi:hypothetical protein
MVTSLLLRLERFVCSAADLHGQLYDLEALCLDTIVTPVGFCHNDLQAGMLGQYATSAIFVARALLRLLRLAVTSIQALPCADKISFV